MSWQSPYVQMKEARRERRIMAKPVCPSCGWACDVCFRERACCLKKRQVVEELFAK